MGIIFRDEEGFDEVEVVVAGRNNVKVGGKGERAEKLFLHYAQRSDSLSDLLLITIPRAIGFDQHVLFSGGPKTICAADWTGLLRTAMASRSALNLLNKYNANKQTNKQTNKKTTGLGG